MTARMRRMAARYGLLGLLIAGAYVLAQIVWSRKPLRWAAAAIIFIAVLCILTSSSYRCRETGGTAVASALPGSDEPLAYDIVDLGTHGEGVFATGMNANGDVSGVAILSE